MAIFTSHNVIKFHLCYNMYPNIIPFYGWRIFRCVDIHILSNHSSTDRHLSRVYFWLIVNDAAMNTRVQDFLWTYVVTSLGCISMSGITEFMVASCSPFWSNAKVFSKAAAPFYIPTSNVWGLQCLRILPHIRCLLWVITILLGISLWFWLVFPTDIWKLSIFPCSLAICLSSFEENLSKSFANFKIGLSFLLLNGNGFLYILHSRPFSNMWFASVFFHSVSCLSTLLIVPFEDQSFWLSLISCCASDIISEKSLSNPELWRFEPKFSLESFTVLVITHRQLTRLCILYVKSHLIHLLLM